MFLAMLKIYRPDQSVQTFYADFNRVRKVIDDLSTTDLNPGYKFELYLRDRLTGEMVLVRTFEGESNEKEHDNISVLSEA